MKLRGGTVEEMNRLLDDGIKPHIEAIAPIAMNGRIAVVVFQPGAELQGALRNIGWDGTAAVFELSPARASAMAAESAKLGDSVTQAWLVEPRTGRIFLWAQSGTLLVNFVSGRGFSIEPGSLDGERVG
ncbi:MAG: hypothetical protein WKG00_38910 [Polyangiaceae bacterium]